MGIYISNMEMPKTCCECDLKTYDPEKVWNDNGIERIGVWVCKRTREIIWNTQRGENCPLIPLPKGHGRLVDADALKKYWQECEEKLGPENTLDLLTYHDVLSEAVIYDLDKAPTIVPAEGGGEDGK